MLAEGSHEITLTLHYPLAHALTKGFRACVPLRRICGLCKGLYHHNGVWHESTRPQIHRFRPQARAPPLGVSLPHQRCGDGEVDAGAAHARLAARLQPCKLAAALRGGIGVDEVLPGNAQAVADGLERWAGEVSLSSHFIRGKDTHGTHKA